MIRFARIRVICLVATFAIMCIFGAAPHILALAVGHRIARFLGRGDESAYRRRAARWQILWGSAIYAGLRFFLGIRDDVRLPPGLRRGRPVIVIANHRSMVDMLLIAVMLGRRGLKDLRWVMADERRRDLLIPWACAEGGSVFIPRDRGDDAVEELRRCAAMARADGASVVIFPEGTRFRGPKEGSGLRHVLPPKPRGFSTFREELPDYPVLSLTILWRGLAGGRRLEKMREYAGRHLLFFGTLTQRIEGMTDAEFLDEEFKKKDAAIAADA